MNCEYCNKEFTPKRVSSKYCSFECRKKRNKEYYASDKVRAKQRQRWNNNKERYKKIARDWKLEHKDEYLAKQREYYQKNKEIVREKKESIRMRSNMDFYHEVLKRPLDFIGGNGDFSYHVMMTRFELPRDRAKAIAVCLNQDKLRGKIEVK